MNKGSWVDQQTVISGGEENGQVKTKEKQSRYKNGRENRLRGEGCWGGLGQLWREKQTNKLSENTKRTNRH